MPDPFYAVGQIPPGFDKKIFAAPGDLTRHFYMRETAGSSDPAAQKYGCRIESGMTRAVSFLRKQESILIQA